MHRYVNLSLLFCLFGFLDVHGSEYEKVQQDAAYKKYFQEQEQIYQELKKLRIPGARSLDMDQDLAESVLATAPK